MTEQEVILMADASGLSYYGMGKDRAKFIHYLERFAALVAAHEREACAKVCDDLPPPEGYSIVEISFWDITSLACGDAIRARGTT
jgi:hypothetical protein